MQTMQTMTENMNHHHNSSRRGGRSRQNRKKKYCWTHGNGNHNGYECNNPHKDHKMKQRTTTKWEAVHGFAALLVTTTIHKTPEGVGHVV